jgi:all-trans-retinol 13,14-reductase
MNPPEQPQNPSLFDSIVIGAGISGLTAAAYLARGGARVLVCERSPKIGGLFNSFEKEGYTFDGGIKAVVNTGIVLPMLAQLGIYDQLDLHPSRTAFITAGKYHPMRDPTEIESYFNFLAGLFPNCSAGLAQVLKDVRRIDELLGALLNIPNPLFAPKEEIKNLVSVWFRENSAALTKALRPMLLLKTPLHEYLKKHLPDPRLVNLINEVFPDGTTTFFGLGYFHLFRDYTYPAGGIGSIPKALARVIEQNGGTILTDAEVNRILLENGKACGVSLTDGRKFCSGSVLSTADARLTFTQLLPDGVIPGSFLKKMLKAKPSHSAVNVFLGINIPVEELNLQGCNHIFFMPDLEGITENDRIDRKDYFSRVLQEISVPCLHNPELAPKGKTGMILSAMTRWEYANGWELENDTPTPAYYELKKRIADEMVHSLESFIPGLSRKVELCITGTPYTIWQHTGNWQGAIMGWSYDQKESYNRVNFLRIPKAVDTPIPGLYNSGHWAFSPGGSPIAVLTAKLAADRILKT